MNYFAGELSPSMKGYKMNYITTLPSFDLVFLFSLADNNDVDVRELFYDYKEQMT